MFIQKPQKGRRFVISDIHGCAQTFDALLKKIDLQPTDQLFLLGDFIVRGPQSARVLDKLIDLADQGFNVYPLRGNHEEAFLESTRKNILLSAHFHAKHNNITDMLDETLHPIPRYMHLLRSMPFYYELDNFYLVHAGFSSKEPFTDTHAMMTIRGMVYNAQIFKNKRIVFGHQPHKFNIISKAVDRKSTLLPLDNGCVYASLKTDRYQSEGYGRLCCLNLDKLELIIQKNCESE